MKSIKLDRGGRIRAHRKLWRWVSKNPGEHKDQWPKWEFNSGRYPRQVNDCFLCFYSCDECPLEWPEITCGGLHGKWVHYSFERHQGLQKAAEIAKQIAELKVKKEKY